MQGSFLVHSDASEAQQEQVSRAFLYSDSKSLLKKNRNLKIKRRHQMGDLLCITMQCFYYGWKISPLCSKTQPNLFGEIVKENVEAFM